MPTAESVSRGGTRRIAILGAPGAGKSTLGDLLAKHLGVPYFPLDPVAFIDDRWTPRPLAERQTMVAEIVSLPGWVAEGGHLGWTDPLVAAADLIVWLDPPLYTLLWRAGVRHLQRRLRHKPMRPDVRALLIEGWLFVARYYWQGYHPGLDLDNAYNLSRAATGATLAPFAPKVLHSRASRLSPVVVLRQFSYATKTAT